MSQPHDDRPVRHTSTPSNTTGATISTTGDRIGLAVSALMFLGGLWLMAAPFIVDYQHRTGSWTDGTISIFTVGGAITVISLIIATTQVGGMLFDLSRTSRFHQHNESTTDNNPTGGSVSQL